MKTKYPNVFKGKELSDLNSGLRLNEDGHRCMILKDIARESVNQTACRTTSPHRYLGTHMVNMRDRATFKR